MFSSKGTLWTLLHRASFLPVRNFHSTFIQLLSCYFLSSHQVKILSQALHDSQSSPLTVPSVAEGTDVHAGAASSCILSNLSLFCISPHFFSTLTGYNMEPRCMLLLFIFLNHFVVFLSNFNTERA